MKQRILPTLVLGIALCIGSPARAAITAFWQPVTITPQAIADDPTLANMQSWDLMVTTTGNWAAGHLSALLPSGLFFYKHPMGTFKHPSPAAIADFPALEFTTYVNTPNDNGLNNDNTLLLGGFPSGPASLGDITAPFPGIFSLSWGDLFVDPPGTFQIARLTSPVAMLPDVITPDQSANPSHTGQVTPDSAAPIPDIPEPCAALCTAFLGLLRWRGRSRLTSASPDCESPRLLSFSAAGDAAGWIDGSCVGVISGMGDAKSRCLPIQTRIFA